MLHLAKGEFYDEQGRIVTLRGINFAADTKTPLREDGRYINTPCSLEESDEHFTRLKALGYNCIRFLYVWDALQPHHPDELDFEYMDFAIALIRKAINEYGFYVFMDPHQDIWSRFSGGSGAPEWTFFAAGLDPEHFQETQAAMLWDPHQEKQIKMLWASNYARLACLTMFTLFFAGKEYAPKAQINGINVGTYLKDKFFWAVGEFMKRVEAADLGPKLLGWESMNEPGHGLIGYEHLNKFPKSRVHVKLGTAPTPFQAMLLGQGIGQGVETYKFTPFGMRRIEVSRHIAPEHSAWLTKEKLTALDEKCGWQRSWPGGCIWELHGVYDSATQELLQPHYFQNVPRTSSKQTSSGSSSGSSSHSGGGRPGETSDNGSDTNSPESESDGEVVQSSSLEHIESTDMRVFVDHFFVAHWKEFSKLTTSVNKDWFQFMQSPVNAAPPVMKHYGPDVMPSHRVVYTPHFYDGMTLMLKRWRFLNVDTIGVMRDLHSSPLTALRFGDSQIANSFVKQFKYLKSEGYERMGSEVPFLMSEIGIPYDMNHKHAYTSGQFDHQIRAMDANLRGLAKSDSNFTLWCYAVHNSHAYGDGFQGEDLSIWSKEDRVPELDGKIENGLRAAEAVIRPAPVALAGPLIDIDFDFRAEKFRITVLPKVEAPSILFIPSFHFPADNGLVVIDVSDGTFTRDGDYLQWNHHTQNREQTLMIQGVPNDKYPYSYFDMIGHILYSLRNTLMGM